MKINYIIGILTLFLLASCGEESSDYKPKPKGYNRIILPEHAYQPIESGHPYFFEYSKHAVARQDTTGIYENHWKQIYYPDLGAQIDITYKPLSDSVKLAGVINDAYKLMYKHDVKAYSIDELALKTRKGYPAMIFHLQGEVPSQYQFIAHDSSDHFLRGALYMPTALKNDSLKPVIEYVFQDLQHMIGTLEWRYE